MAGSTELMERFQRKYGLTRSFDELAAESDSIAKKFKYLNNFLQTNQRGSEAQKKYISNLFYMLNSVIESRLNPSPNEAKQYDLDSLDVHQFIKDYEGIMDAKYEESGAEKQRPPYAGTEAYVLDMAESRMREYSKPLAELWAERIKVGSIDIIKMREITDRKYGELRNRFFSGEEDAADRANDENSIDSEKTIDIENNTDIENSTDSEKSILINDQNDSNFISLDDSFDVTLNNDDEATMENAIIMHEALKTVVAKRTIGTYLWPGNWGNISRENKYLETLAAQIEDYKRLDEDIVTKTLEKYERFMTTAHESLKEAKEAAIARSAQRKAEKQESKNVIKENIKIDENIKKEEAKVVDPMPHTISQIQKVFRIGDDEAENLVDFANDRIEIIKDKIDAKNAYPLDYANFTFNTFNDAYELLKDEYGLDNKEAIIKAQSMTNVILNAYAKDVFPKTNFEEVSNNYVVQNKTTLSMGLGGSFKGNVSKLFEEVKAEYSKEKINLDLDDKTNKEVSEPVTNEKKPDVRSLNN